MKKVMKCVCMIVLVALPFTSCNKAEKKHSSTFRATIKDAGFEVVGEDKAYVAPDNTIQFEQGDVCMIFNIDENHPANSQCATYEALESGNCVEFQNCGLGEVAEDRLDYFIAFYPGGSDRLQSQLGEDYNKAKFIIPEEQNYRENMVSRGDLIMSAMVNKTKLSQGRFVFESIMGVLQLQPYESAQRSVTKIEVIDNFINLTGEMILRIDELDKDKSSIVFDAMDGSKAENNKMTLNLPSGGVQLGNSKASTPKFNIALRPLAMYNGCHIVFTFDDGNVKDVEIASNVIYIKPNVVTNVGLNLDNY